jgi:hypothetical protein
MATVTLDRAWLSLASDPAQAVSFFTGRGGGDDRAKPGEVRQYANGRLRSVSRAGSATTLGVTARNLTAGQVAQIDGWRGAVVLFRDVWGRKLYGTYFRISVADYVDRSGQDVTFTLQQVTHSEAV